MPTRRVELAEMTPTERGKYMGLVFQEAKEYRRKNYESDWIDSFRLFRALKDQNTPYEADMVHPYTWATLTAIHATLYPTLLAADPMFHIDDPDTEHYDRNQWLEKVISAQVQNPKRSNFRTAWDKILTDALVFGGTYPWVSWRSERKLIGPRYRPVDLPDGTPATDERGRFVVEKVYKRVQTFHGPWVDHVKPFDTFLHPDAKQGLTRRKATGYELLRQSEGPTPRYDPKLVNRMLNMEARSEMRQRTTGGGFGADTALDEEEDRLERELGRESPTEQERIAESSVDKVLSKTYRIMHFDDGGEHQGAYAVNDSEEFFELAFDDATPDGMGSRMKLVLNTSPSEEVYGPSLIDINKGLIEAQTRTFQGALDGAAITMHPMWAMSEQMRQDQGELVVGPGYTVTVPIGPMGGKVQDHIQRLDMPQSWINAFNIVAALSEALDQGMGASDFLKGQFSGGKRTAREVGVVASFTEARIRQYHERIVHQFAVPMMQKFLVLDTTHYQPADYVKLIGQAGAIGLFQAGGPPDVDEIIEDLHFIPKGTLESTNAALRQGHWPAIIQVLIQAAPYFSVSYIREAVKRMIEDFGMASTSALIPDDQDPRLSEHLANLLMAQQMVAAGGGGGRGAPGGSLPGARREGEADQLRAEGGAEAPPGPVTGGRVANGPGGNGFGRF